MKNITLTFTVEQASALFQVPLFRDILLSSLADLQSAATFRPVLTFEQKADAFIRDFIAKNPNCGWIATIKAMRSFAYEQNPNSELSYLAGAKRFVEGYRHLMNP